MTNFVLGRVSVIVPAKNSEISIYRCLASLKHQTYHDIEIIFVNNNSTDNTKEIASQVLATSTFNVIILDEYEQGVSFARNKGLSYASGQFICFLDSDDALYPESIERRVIFLQKESIGLCFGNYDIIYTNGIMKTRKLPKTVTKFNKFYSNWIPNLCGMYDRSKINIVYQDNIGHEDYLMWLKLLESTEIALNIGGAPLSQYYKSKYSLSANKIKSAIWHYNILKLQDFGLAWRIIFFCGYISLQIKRIIYQYFST